MASFTLVREVRASPETVFDVLTDHRRYSEMTGLRKSVLEREGEKTAFEIVAEIVGADNVNTPVSAWVLQIVLSCLDHLVIVGEVVKVEGTDPQRWRLA